MDSTLRIICWGCARLGVYAKCSRCGVALCNLCQQNNPHTKVQACPAAGCKRLVCGDTCRKCVLHLMPAAQAVEVKELDPRQAMLTDALAYIDREASDHDNFESLQDRLGDVIFLLAKAALRLKDGPIKAEVSRQTKHFIKEYDRMFGDKPLEFSPDAGNFTNWLECMHARIELRSLPAGVTPADVKRLVVQRLATHKVGEVFSNPPDVKARNANNLPMTMNVYCRKCGVFRKGKQCTKCKSKVSRIIDSECIVHSMVWSSILHDVGADPAQFKDYTASVLDTVELIPKLRPWADYSDIHFQGFLLQGYLITHFVFIMSNWGAYRLPRALFEPEFSHITRNMYGAVANKHVDLVGEFIYTLRLLGAPDNHPAIVEGTNFLLDTQRTRRDDFYEHDEPFHVRFHTAYCVLYGLGEWQFGSTPARLPYALPAPEEKMDVIEEKVDSTRQDVTTLYNIISTHTLQLANGSGGSVYGEMTQHSMQTILELLVNEAGLGASSKFIDVGAGLGKPSLHAALYPGVTVSFGVEVSKERWQLSLINLHYALKQFPELRTKPRVCFQEADAKQLKTLDPFTHVFLFDAAFTDDLRDALSQALNQSTTVTHVLSFQPLHKFALNADPVQKTRVSLTGSGESRTGNLYRMRRNDAAPLPYAPEISEGLKQLGASFADYEQRIAKLVKQFQDAPRQTRSGRVAKQSE